MRQRRVDVLVAQSAQPGVQIVVQGRIHGQERQQLRMPRHLELHGEIIGVLGVIGGQSVDLNGLFLLGKPAFGDAVEH